MLFTGKRRVLVEQFPLLVLHRHDVGGKLCIAEGTEVLSCIGWVPVEAYYPGLRLWDGESWVHGGNLLVQGVRHVIYYEGVWLTPDHEVLSDEGWKPAEAMASSKR